MMHVSHIPRLEVLDVSFCPRVSDNGLQQHIAPLPLAALYVEGNDRVTDAALRALAHVPEVFIAGSGATGAGAPNAVLQVSVWCIGKGVFVFKRFYMVECTVQFFGARAGGIDCWIGRHRRRRTQRSAAGEVAVHAAEQIGIGLFDSGARTTGVAGVRHRRCCTAQCGSTGSDLDCSYSYYLHYIPQCYCHIASRIVRRIRRGANEAQP